MSLPLCRQVEMAPDLTRKKRTLTTFCRSAKSCLQLSPDHLITKGWDPVMENTIGVDENAQCISPQKDGICEKQSLPAKSPLKPVNDESRLFGLQGQHSGTPKSKLVTPKSSPYTSIRQLDSAERWIERTSVVTKQDHHTNQENALSIVTDLVNKAPIDSSVNPWISKAISEMERKDSVQEKMTDGSSSLQTTCDMDDLANLLSGLDLAPKTLDLIAGEEANTVSDHDVFVKPSVPSTCTSGRVNNVKSIEVHDLNETDQDVDESWHSAVDITVGVNSPGKVMDVPVKCKSQIANSPVQAIEDPFKTKSQITNSPVQEKEDPFKTKSQIANSPVQAIEDPFKTKSQIANSPVQEIQDPFKTKSQIANSPVQEIEDPFKTKSQIENSPVQEIEDPFKTKSQIANSPVQEKEDPFKTKSQIENLPVQEIEDPFKTKSQIANSPVQEIEDPFKTKSQIANSPVQEIEDPFKTKSQIANSPVQEIEDPVKTKSQDTRNSPNAEKKGSEDTNEVDSKVSNFFSNSSLLDAGLLDSKNGSRADGNSQRSSVPVRNMESCSELENLSSAESVEPSKKTDAGEFEDEEEFLPAAQIFDNPNFFDMLENMQSSVEANTKRTSVLLKFDPLQEDGDSGFIKPACTARGAKQPRASDVFKNVKPVVGSDDSICLFGTPPHVARRRTLTRKQHNARVSSIEEETPASEVDAIFGMDDGQSSAMDTILQDNLALKESNTGQLVDVDEFPAYTEKEVKDIKSRLLMQCQELLLKKDKEFQEKLKENDEEHAKKCSELESEKTKLKADLATLSKNNKSLQGKMADLRKVMKEYTDMIDLISVEKEKADAEKEQLKQEKAQMLEDNKTLEKSFDDLYNRYDKLKKTLEKAVENEKVLHQALDTAHKKYTARDESAKKIKEVAESKLKELQEKYDSLSSSSKAEIMRLEAAVKRKEVQVQSLETTVEQKMKESKELMDLCDSFINKTSNK